MAKFLRFDKAVQSKVYSEIVQECEIKLEDKGYFAKIDVIDGAGYDAIADDIRWDYVRRMIEERHETELIPLAPSYFKRHRRDEEKQFTEKFVARGNGRRTVGYANASEQNGHFVIHRIKIKTKMSVAFATSAERTRQIGIRQGAISADVPLLKTVKK